MMPLYLKHVAFVGNFKDGSLPLKDIVYQAGGAPVDSVAHYTSYLVVGDGGRDTALYRKWESNIRKGYLIEMDEEGLRRIAVGLIEAPEPDHRPKDGTIKWTTEEAESRITELEIINWVNKRDAFVEKYGQPLPNGSRIK